VAPRSRAPRELEQEQVVGVVRIGAERVRQIEQRALGKLREVAY
jgi:DNA-directed RNA polymerase sigma subunit (sigma70/sigma32)